MRDLKHFLIYISKNLFEKIVPLLIVIASLMSIISLLKDNTASDNLEKLFTNSKIGIIIIGVATTSILIPFIIKFLNTERIFKDEISTNKKLHDRAEAKIRYELINKSIKAALDNDTGIQNLERRLYRRIQSNLEESVLKKVEEKKELDGTNAILMRKVNADLEPLINNTIKYILTIQKNSIINLSIGITGSIFAICILGFSLLSEQKYSTLQDFAIHLTPRLTFALFIQLFAFFFLRLYKNNLEDGKYFQNELTNISAKCSSLKIAVLTKNIDKQSEILSNLSKVERNFKLRKEETLLNIEKAKIEKEYDLELLNAFKSFLRTKEKE